MLSFSLLSCASLSFLYSLSYHFLTKARKLNHVFAFAKDLQ